MSRRPIAAPLLACAAIAAAILSGCGDDGGGGDVDVGPAAAVPQSAPIYVDGTIKPQGAAATNANAALGKILDTNDPSAKLIELIDKEARQQPPNERFTYERDIAPWIGDQVGFFTTTFAQDNDGTAVVETTNPQAALAFAQRSESGATEQRQYDGTTYFRNPGDGDTFATVGDFLVFGEEADVKAAIDANAGDSLGDSSDFKDAISELPDDRLGTFFTVPKTLLDAMPADQLGPGVRSAFENIAGDNLSEPVGGALTASADSLNLEFRSQGESDVETPQSALLGDVPSASWLALGIGDLGANLKRTVERLKSEDIPGIDVGTTEAQIQSATGFSVDDLAEALGDGVLYVQGTTQQSLSGALVIQSKDPSVTKSLLDRTQGLIQQAGSLIGVEASPLSGSGLTGFRVIDKSGNFLPAPVEFAQQGGKVVVGYGAGSAQQALAGGQRLSGNPSFTAAEGQVSDLGADLFLSFPAIFRLAESSGAKRDPDYRQARPYINHLGYLISGSGNVDGKAELKAVLGLK